MVKEAANEMNRDLRGEKSTQTKGNCSLTIRIGVVDSAYSDEEGQ